MNTIKTLVRLPFSRIFNSFPRSLGLQFVPSISTIRYVGSQFVPSILTSNNSRERSERFFDGDGDGDAAFCFTLYLRFKHQLESSIEVTQNLSQLSKKVNLRFFEKCKKLRVLKFEKKLKYLSKNSKFSESFDLSFIREIQTRALA